MNAYQHFVHKERKYLAFYILTDSSS